MHKMLNAKLYSLFLDDDLVDEDIQDYLNMVNTEDVDTNRINTLISSK